MPYGRLNDFMTRVRGANPTFERARRSSLRPLITILQDPNGNAAQVEGVIPLIPVAKALKYKNALYFLQQTYPGIAPNTVQFGPLGKSNAARFTQTVMPPAFNPQIPVQDRVIAPSAFVNTTVEHFIINTVPAPGIILIHLSTFIANMNDVFEGDKVVDHMKSVLRVGLEAGSDLCILSQNAPVVCSALEPEVNAFLPRTTAHVHPQHMGARNATFRNFAANHATTVVMGFDASVCVRANAFGSTERMPAPPDPPPYVAPLVTLTDMVTSRAVLVTGGNICPIAHRGEWGVLFNT